MDKMVKGVTESMYRVYYQELWPPAPGAFLVCPSSNQPGVQLARAMGNKVTAISSSPAKEALAVSAGASRFVFSVDPVSMRAAKESIDLLLNTAPAQQQISHLMPLMAR